MNAYFSDSFYYLALLNPDDKDHARVVGLTRVLDRPLVTTAWVLTEVGDAFASPRHRPAFVNLFDALRVDDAVTVIAPSQELFDQGVELYRSRSDKYWSLTDCISFVVMRNQNLQKALTADHHFEQAGFVALLK